MAEPTNLPTHNAARDADGGGATDGKWTTTRACASRIAPWTAHAWIDPPRSRDRILLASALAEFCGGEWGMSGDEIAAAGGGSEESRGDTDRLRSACNLIGRLLFEGRVRAWARPIGGGEPIEIRACAWELDDFTARMSTSAIDPALPFDANARPTHWVFLSEPDWEDALGRLWGGRQLGEPATGRRDDRVRVEVALAATGHDTAPPLQEPDRDDRLLRLPEVLHRTGLSRATLYRRIAAGEFPEGLSLGGNVTAWLERAVDYWITTRQRTAR